FRRWVVQEDGRNKPFDSLCIDTVRSVTFRERFEKNDPVAVVVSWMMTYREDESGRPDYGAMRAVGKKLGCDWENYPFILCDYQELRQIIFADAPKEPETIGGEEQKYGKYVEPERLRRSTPSSDL